MKRMMLLVVVVAVVTALSATPVFAQEGSSGQNTELFEIFLDKTQDDFLVDIVFERTTPVPERELAKPSGLPWPLRP